MANIALVTLCITWEYISISLGCYEHQVKTVYGKSLDPSTKKKKKKATQQGLYIIQIVTTIHF